MLELDIWDLMSRASSIGMVDGSSWGAIIEDGARVRVIPFGEAKGESVISLFGRVM